MGAVKRILKAFVVGCGVGLIGQILIAIFSRFIDDPMLTILVSMLAFGCLGVVMIITGFYFKVAKFGGNGAAIPVCGLMHGAAVCAAAAEKAGAGAGKAFLVGFWSVIKILGTGFIIAFILGLFLH